MTAIPPDRTEGEAGHIDDHHAVNAVLTEHAADIATRALDADLVSGLAAKLDTPGAWTAFTPTITAASGSFTTVSATGKYCQIGKTLFVSVKIDITTNGTAAAGVRFTLPGDAPVGTLTYSGTGRENNVTGSMCQVVTGIGSTFATVFTYGNAHPGGDGYSLLCTLTYELA